MQTACIKPIPLPAEYAGRNIVNHLRDDAAQRKQLVALVKARLAGIKAILGTVEFDVIAQQPANIYLATRTFFTQPSHIFASNESITRFLDASDINHPHFFENKRGDNLLALLLGFPLNPKDAVHILLGSSDIRDEDIKNIDYDDRKGIIKISTSHTPVVKTISFSVTQQRITAYSFENRVDKLSYTVSLSDFRNESNIPFAHQWRIAVQNNRQRFEIVLHAKEVQLNGPSYDAEVFDVERP